MSLTDIIHSKEEDLRHVKDHEVAIVYDAVGNLVVEKHGDGSSVDLGPYIERVRCTGQATLLHNHPLGWRYPPNDPRHVGGSFSPEDIATACYAELVEIRAIGPRTRYVMRPAATYKWSGGYWLNDVFPSLEMHKATAIRSTLQEVAAGRKSREAAEAGFWHQVWLRVAADLSLEYERFEDE